MVSVRTLFVAGLLFGAAALPCPASAADDLPGLLTRLAAQEETVERLQRNMNCETTLRLDVMDSDGVVERSEELVTRLSVRDGRVEHEIVRATADGKDVTAKRRRAHRREHRALAAVFASPFAAAAQPAWRFRSLGADESDPAMVRIAFEPLTPGAAAGEAVVDPIEGTLVRLLLRPSSKAGWLGKQMEFAESAAGHTLTTVTAEGRARVGFSTMRYRMTSSVTDYALVIPAASL